MSSKTQCFNLSPPRLIPQAPCTLRLSHMPSSSRLWEMYYSLIIWDLFLFLYLWCYSQTTYFIKMRIAKVENTTKNKDLIRVILFSYLKFRMQHQWATTPKNSISTLILLMIPNNFQTVCSYYAETVTSEILLRALCPGRVSRPYYTSSVWWKRYGVCVVYSAVYLSITFRFIILASCQESM